MNCSRIWIACMCVCVCVCVCVCMLACLHVCDPKGLFMLPTAAFYGAFSIQENLCLIYSDEFVNEQSYTEPNSFDP